MNARTIFHWFAALTREILFLPPEDSQKLVRSQERRHVSEVADS